jgi:hypothetical protein
MLLFGGILCTLVILGIPGIPGTASSAEGAEKLGSFAFTVGHS